MTVTASASDIVSNNIALKLSNTQKTILKKLERYTLDLNKVTKNDITNLMDYMSENSRRLNNLLNKNRNLSEEIQAKLDLFSFYKKSFSKSQIKLYNEYISVKSKEKTLIKNCLMSINDRDSIKKLTNLLLDDNYNKIAEQITFILLKQNKAIKKLEKITSKASKFLKTFNK